MNEKKLIYADCAATTPVTSEVLAVMLPWLTEEYGNPSSSHGPGRRAKKAVTQARAQVAALIGALPEEIVFTSCGTEGINQAIRGVAEVGLPQGRRRILVSAMEHPAVLRAAEAMIPRGCTVEYIPVEENGVVSLPALRAMMGGDCALCAVMHVNNETGVIQPVGDCVSIAHEHGALFLADGVQSTGHIPVDVKAMDCDFFAVSGHKLNGPKGIGALYVKKGLALPPFVHGGGQEGGRRSGTENVPGIVGLGEACRLAAEGLANGEGKRIEAYRNRMEEELLALGCARVNGSAPRVPGTLNIGFRCVEGESLMLLCDMHGLAISTGSACANGHGDEVSHVLRALAVPEEYANGSVRISIGRATGEAEVEALLRILTDCVRKLREVSAEWQNIDK